jgi:hypothetical protein
MLNAKRFQFYILKATGHSMVGLLGLGYSTVAFAYLDPGTGSIILQGFIAGIMVVVAAWGMFWQRIKSFFSSLFSSTKSTKNNSGRDAD